MRNFCGMYRSPSPDAPFPIEEEEGAGFLKEIEASSNQEVTAVAILRLKPLCDAQNTNLRDLKSSGQDVDEMHATGAKFCLPDQGFLR